MTIEAGRPVVIVQPKANGNAAFRLDTVVVALEGSRPAARAVADAMPLLCRARAVHILTVLHEKEDAISGLGVELVRHLGMHGIEARVDEVDANGFSIGAVLGEYVRSLTRRPAGDGCIWPFARSRNLAGRCYSERINRTAGAHPAFALATDRSNR